MYRFSYSSPRFKGGETVTNGVRIGVVEGRVFNRLLGREHTDRWYVLWKRDLSGRYLPRDTRTEEDGTHLSKYRFKSR
jgi:hypothetical protein